MSPRHESPWASGPAEILKHAVALLGKDSDANRRIAMILVDNSVEQAIKTYLSLPKRVSGISVSRRKFAEIAESFPSLLDALEEHAADKLDGIDLGAIEWYHRLRNELYHQGFGLTVERDKVEVYAELAQTLLRNLFDHEIPIKVGPDAEMIGRFIELWNRLESVLGYAATDHVLERPHRLVDAVGILRGADAISGEEAASIEEFRRVRNQVVHAHGDYKDRLTPQLMSQIEEFTRALEETQGIDSE